MEHDNVNLKNTPAIIMQYDLAAIHGENREIEYKNLIMIIGPHKMIIPQAKLIVDGGVDVSDNKPRKGSKDKGKN